MRQLGTRSGPGPGPGHIRCRLPREFPASSALPASKAGPALLSGACPAGSAHRNTAGWLGRGHPGRSLSPCAVAETARPGCPPASRPLPPAPTTRAPGPSWQRWPQKDQQLGAGGQGRPGGQMGGQLRTPAPQSPGPHPSEPHMGLRGAAHNPWGVIRGRGGQPRALAPWPGGRELAHLSLPGSLPSLTLRSLSPKQTGRSHLASRG